MHIYTAIYLDRFCFLIVISISIGIGPCIDLVLLLQQHQVPDDFLALRLLRFKQGAVACGIAAARVRAVRD